MAFNQGPLRSPDLEVIPLSLYTQADGGTGHLSHQTSREGQWVSMNCSLQSSAIVPVPLKTNAHQAHPPASHSYVIGHANALIPPTVWSTALGMQFCNNKKQVSWFHSQISTLNLRQGKGCRWHTAAQSDRQRYVHLDWVHSWGQPVLFYPHHLAGHPAGAPSLCALMKTRTPLL